MSNDPTCVFKTKTKTSRAIYWQKHLSQWSESGLTQAEYCRRNKLSAAAFNWWKGQLRRKSSKSTPTRSRSS
ncbi:MAG: IS66 family insertion sequence element accessory protein TnpA [Candidatus Hermodarchaeia archaeon]